MKKIIVFVLIGMAMAGCRTYSHYLIVCENFKRQKIEAARVQTPDTANLEQYYPVLTSKFDSLMRESKGNFSFYSEHKLPKKTLKAK